MAEEKVGIDIEANLKVNEKQAEEAGRKAGKIVGNAVASETEKALKRTQVLGQRRVSKGGMGMPGVDAQLKEYAKGVGASVKEIFNDLKSFRLEKTANNGLGIHSALSKGLRERMQESELYGGNQKLKDMFDTKLEFKDTIFEGLFNGSVLEGAGKKLVGLFADSKKEADGLAKAIEKAAQSEEKLKNNTAGAVKSAEKLGSSKFADIFLHGTNAAKRNAAIATTKKRIRELEPSSEDYRYAAIRLNVGYHPDDERKQVRASRARIKQYEAEIKTLEKLQKTETASTGGLFSNKLRTALSKKLGILSDKNSIFDKKTIKDNGLLSVAGYRSLRLAEVGVTSLGKALRSLGATALKPVLSPMKRLSRWIKDIGRRLRGQIIRTIARTIISLAKEGLKNLQDYSKNLGTPFNENIKRLSSSLNYLKNAFAAMVAPIINYVTPALERLMDTIAALANQVGAFFAAITGQTQFSAALKKTVSDASSAAGKLKDLFGFDEINRLSGDAGGGSGLDYAFEEWDPESGIFGQIKTLVDSGQWEELGAQLAGKLNNLVSGFDAQGLGSNIAGKINNAVSLAKGFVTNTNFAEIGEKLAGFIDGLLDVDPADFATTISGVVTGFLDLAISFVTNLPWQKLGTSIGTFITTTFENLANWLETTDWEMVGKDLIDGIEGFAEGLDLGKIIKALWRGIKALVTGIGKLFIGIFKEVWNTLIAPWIEERVNNMPDWLWDLISGGQSKEEFNASLYFTFDEQSAKNVEKKRDELGSDIKSTVKVSANTEPAKAKVEKFREDTMTVKDGIEKKPITLKATSKLEGIPDSRLKEEENKAQKKVDNLPGIGYASAIEAPTNSSNVYKGAKTAVAKLTAIPFGTKLSDIANQAKVKNAAQTAVSKLSDVLYKPSLKEIGNTTTVKNDAQKKVNNYGAITYKSSAKDITNTSTVRTTAQEKVNKLTAIGYGTSAKDITNTGSVKKSAQKSVDGLGNIDFKAAAKAIGNIDARKTEAQTAASKLTAIGFSTSAKAIGNVSDRRDAAQKAASEEDYIRYATAVKSPTNISKIATKAQTKADEQDPIVLSTLLSSAGLPDAISKIYGKLQNAVNETPIVIPTAIATSKQSSATTAAREKTLAGTKMARGGSVPNIGSLILAGESGPEVVANMGNRTGVMNVQQMEAAVSNGNIDVVNAIYTLLNTMVQTVNNKNLDVYLDSDKVGKSVTTYQNNQIRRGIAQGAY